MGSMSSWCGGYELLSSALIQVGPWKGQFLQVDADWLRLNLRDKIRNTNWREAIEEVSRSLKANRKETLSLWSEDFFATKLERLQRIS